MAHTADPLLTNLTPNAEIRKTVAGRALPAPVNWVWGVYDPHPFSCLLFDPPTLPPKCGDRAVFLVPPLLGTPPLTAKLELMSFF